MVNGKTNLKFTRNKICRHYAIKTMCLLAALFGLWHSQIETRKDSRPCHRSGPSNKPCDGVTACDTNRQQPSYWLSVWFNIAGSREEEEGKMGMARQEGAWEQYQVDKWRIYTTLNRLRTLWSQIAGCITRCLLNVGACQRRITLTRMPD